MPQRLADAAHIVPYLTHAASHRTQPTLTPPENAGRQAKSKKNRSSKQDKKARPSREENYSAAPASTSIIPVSQPSNRFNLPLSRRPTGETLVQNNECSFYQQRRFQESRYSDGKNSLNSLILLLKNYVEIPDYPPPSFQEAISSPPLSVCPSTTTLGFYSSGRVIPHSAPVHFDNLSPRGDVNSDSDSEESLEIVQVPVYAGQPGQISRSLAESELEVQRRGRASFDSDAPLTPTSSTRSKRRHVSLSPLRTLFPHKPIALQDRALSAQPASPYSFPRNTSLFRSTTSLKTVSTGSFFRLPLSSMSSTSLVRAERKGSKGKEKSTEPLESWEILGSEQPEPPTSLMSAVESLTNPPSPNSASPSSSPTQNSPSTSVFTYDYVSSPSQSEFSKESESLMPQNSSTFSVGSGVSSSVVLTPSYHRDLLPGASISPSSPVPRKPTASSPLSSQSWDAGHLNLRETPNLLQLAVDTPLPPTPVDNIIRELKLDLQRARSHPMPDRKPRPCASSSNMPAETAHASSILRKQKPVPSPLQLPFPMISPSASVQGLSASTSPTHRHYRGRPLPQTPHSTLMPVDVARNIVDSLYAPHPDAVDSRIGPLCPEGLLIDLNESTPVHSELGTEMNSPASTIRASPSDRADRADSNGQGRAAHGSTRTNVDDNDNVNHNGGSLISIGREVVSGVDPVNTIASNAPEFQALPEAESSRATSTSTRRHVTYSNFTDLDLLLSRLETNDEQNGLDYDVRPTPKALCRYLVY